MKTRLIFMTILFSCLSVQAVEKIKPQHLIRIYLEKSTRKKLSAMDIRFVSFYPDTTALAVVTPAELALLNERQYALDTIMTHKDDLILYKHAYYGETLVLDPIYHTYDEIVQKFKLYQKTYPRIFKTYPIGKTTQSKRPILACKISDNVKKDDDEPAILFSGAIHANEIIGTEICMALIDTLLNNYKTEKRFRDWINHNEIWFVPIINVDGHDMVTQSMDPRWRKNTVDTNFDDTLAYKDGVDINRNFDFNWAHGGSADITSKYYRGPYPFSESESRAIRDLALKEKFLLSLTYHSQGEVIFYPWDWKGRKAPNQKLLTEIANGLGKSIRALDTDTTYVPLYGNATVGQTHSWFYGMFGTLDYMVETGCGRKIYPPKELGEIIHNNIQGAYYLLNQLNGPGLSGHVTDSKSDKPLEARIHIPKMETEELQPRYSDKKQGRFYRKLIHGNYQVIASKKGYHTETFNVNIKKTKWTSLNIELKRMR